MTYVPPDPDDAPSQAELAEPLAPLEFFVPGKPQPAGSKKGIPVKRKTGTLGVAIIDANPRSKGWQAMVAAAALRALAAVGRVSEDGEPETLRGPVGLSLSFNVLRPKSHYNRSGLRAVAPAYPTGKPDTTKLVRGVEDALTGVLWRDDAQVVEQYAGKRYGETEGVRVTVWAL